MSVKSDIYLNNLKLHLGINSLDQITEDHAEEILNFIKKHQDTEVLKELVKIMPDFFSFAKKANEEMNKTCNNIIKAGIIEINVLREIILQLSTMLENEKLSENDKERVFDLIKKFQTTLQDLIDKHQQLKVLIIKGTISVGLLSTAMFGGFLIYKAIGGKGGEEAFANASKNLIEKSLEKTL